MLKIRIISIITNSILADFALFLPQSASVSVRGNFFPVSGNISHVQGSISNARVTFATKTPTGSNLEPQIRPNT